MVGKWEGGPNFYKQKKYNGGASNSGPTGKAKKNFVGQVAKALAKGKRSKNVR